MRQALFPVQQAAPHSRQRRAEKHDKVPPSQLTASGPQGPQHASLQQLIAASPRNQALQDVAQRLTAGPAAPVQLDKKKSKHDRKDRRLAKESGLHPDDVDTNPRAIEAELALRYDDDDTEEQDQEAPDLAEVALSLQGKFIWTSPGGMLEYTTLFKHWASYKAVLRKRIPQARHEQFDGLSDDLEEIDTTSDEETIAKASGAIFDSIGKLFGNAGDTGGFITLGDQFEPWLRTGKEPQHLNCWEATLYACDKVGKLSRATMYAYYKDSKGKSSEHVFRKFVLNRSMEMILDSDSDEVIPDHQPVENAVSGDILCFWEESAIHHVAIYLGAGQCMSIWVEDTMNFSTTSFSKLAANYGEDLHLEIVKF